MKRPNSELTVERLRSLFSYDEKTGIFTRRVKRGIKFQPGEVAGSKPDRDGHVRISVDYVRYQAHRLAWLYVHGKWPSKSLDHVNGIGSDNRIENLREATSSENQQNLRRPLKRNQSKLLGAFIQRKGGHVGWAAAIGINGKQKYLGYFKTAEGAHAAYLKAKAELHPFAPKEKGATP
jgi:hypothetical protein